MPEAHPKQWRCKFCNEPGDRMVGPCWHCDAGFAPIEETRVMPVPGEGEFRYCPQCHYDLSGNPGVSDCPECGFNLPKGWAQHRMALNRYASTLKAGPVTVRRLLEIGIGASAITLVLCFLNGFRSPRDELWYGSPADRLIAMLTVFTLTVALAAGLLWCATCLITLGRWRYEKQTKPRLEQPAMRCRKSFVFRMACRAATVLLILYFVVSGVS